MPLTYVIEHLNRQLAELHQHSPISRHARLDYRDGEVSAVIGPLVLQSVLSDALHDDPEPLAIRNSSLTARNDLTGARLGADFVYQLAWDADDIVFVDRFVRTFHALNHINQQHGQARLQTLLLDVHWRHLCAVPGAHGQVFEQLLATLGLAPSNIIIRVESHALLYIDKVQEAVRNFLECGYSLCARSVQTKPEESIALHGLGVRWAATTGPDKIVRLAANRGISGKTGERSEQAWRSA